MTTIIDIGNSAAKICTIGRNGEIENSRRVRLNELKATVADFLKTPEAPFILSCSGDKALQVAVEEQLERESVTVLVLDQNGSMPFVSDYAPGQAGIDRLANVAAGIEQAGAPVVIVDAGSAITVEVIGPNGVFLGGAILPGIQLQAEALRKGTAELPLVELDGELPAIGKDTITAIRTGIVNSCAGAVERLLTIMLDQPEMASSAILVTGGDGAFITRLISSFEPNVTLVPALTLRGLYLLARHQFPDHIQNFSQTP